SAPAATAIAPARPATAVGAGALVVLLMPSWPLLLAPQHDTVPAARSAQVKFWPAVIAITLVRPLTGTGARRGVVTVLLPSWPTLLAPQHSTVPAWRSAQVWALPAATATALVMPCTATGDSRLVVVPSPSWPLVFLPQQSTAPDATRAQVWALPPVIAIALV